MSSNTDMFAGGGSIGPLWLVGLVGWLMFRQLAGTEACEWPQSCHLVMCLECW